MSASLEDLIPLVNKLQDLVFNTIGSDTLDLPQVVVVGSQSCGKSSVLENIVGRDFLPRGTGIVTRRPLVLQLVNLPSEEKDRPGSSGEVHTRTPKSNSVEWGEFLHIPGRQFYDFEEIRKEIENETVRIAGNNKGINRIPINLKIFSPHVLNLTLVDLPGLTKIPIGDQPTDIERQTRHLICEYIAKPNSIILAVSPANVDIVNSESLKLARQVDPHGKRTIGILTKLDLMDQGTNAMDILSGRVYPLKLGFIGVINRSQQDIHANKPLSDSLEAEREFFQNHPVYRNISHKCGTQFLAKSLNQTLMNHIREKLPDIKAKLNTLMGQTEQELSSYGVSYLNSGESKGTLILQLMTKFASKFVTSIEGTAAVSTKELCGGARIYYIYNDVFGTALSSISPTANLSINDIRTAIRNSTGPRPSLFVPELAFDMLVKPQIKLLEPPSQRCVELVYEELMKICHNCGSPELSRFPKLQAKLIECVSDLLRERLGPTASYVESLIAIQRAYINTNHPNFIGAADAMATVVEEKKQKENASRQKDMRRKHMDMLPPNGKDTPQAIENGPDDDSTSSRPGSTEGGKDHQREAHHHRTPSTATNASGEPKDTFLNYFFGKDADGNPVMPPPGAAGVKGQFPNGFSSSGGSQKGPHDKKHISDPMDTMASAFDDMDLEEGEQLSDREKLETELIRRLIVSYFNIVRESIQDQVPKAVMHLLVNFSKESVQNRLVSELYKEALFDALLFEDENLAQEREKCETLLKTYKEASKIIGEVI
ncbi:Dynamin central region-domain-containing protein [Yarrowia lipolytica]|jgi:dynamin 1-like protein|uniref:dynamin GTPase n=2 Tax=Yarrowia lipolytica TaxID=4952 RepID=Q6C1G8_YARLI|nr:YALI0F16379p [Yarrowia lipolytica CLIB122]RDW25402.1 Dynamin central region-domain-containing protein [Yarrowia lipolytica]RDW33788.1 Dynamin central region-domain-containing protein [Yarrowia lipolytica]RDW37858.1 Dynamin central region-domain-containing protein [Yarrowia lipolytica]RDW42973.1 Dynamin central region-domain-containing protein [Yarrowia lipolytica]RDW51379.1 Dynamin central region-domain-containing protein [Yarrowia lipolytica]|eukprot:XP_505494.1 YALI0F16379p [Yarrowia lipolytica CLIB122]